MLQQTNNFISKIKQIFATARPSSVAPAGLLGLFAFITVSFTSLHIRLIKCRPCRAKIAALFCGNNIFSKSRRVSILLTVSTTYGKKAITPCQSRRDDTLLTVGATYGTTIRIIAPARRVSLEDIQPAMQLLTSCGYEVDLGRYTLGAYHQFSGTDDERASDLQDAIDEDSVKAIWCARGGYGGLRILDKIDFSKFRQNPKWICGYSDTTALHALINNLLHLPSLHCTMPIHIQNQEDLHKPSLSTMLAALEKGKLTYEIPAHRLNRVGEAKGKLTGGNLSILYALNGSVSDIKTDNSVLFIEEVDEYLYHIDRMMLCLKRAGKLAQLAGLIVGGMSDMHDNTISYGKTAEEIIYEHVAEYDYPVCFGFPAGHIQENSALILGGSITLCIEPKNVYIQNNI